MRTFSLAALAMVTLLLQLPQNQQQMVMKFDPDSTFLISEFPLVASLREAGMVVIMVPPADVRGPAYRDADIRKGDIIVMANGRKITCPADLEEVYESVEPGGAIRMGIRRGDQMIIAAFPKYEKQGSDNSGIRMMIKKQGEQGDRKDDEI